MTAAPKFTQSPPNRRTCSRSITVRKQGRTWAVHADGELIEGGFFSRDAAHEAAAALHEADARAAKVAA